MAKRMKMPRGYYKEAKTYNFQKSRMKLIEFWIKHTTDPLKDIRFYVYWRKHNEIIESWDYVASVGKEDYESHVLLRYIDQPRTRRQKTIYNSQISSLKHLSEII